MRLAPLFFCERHVSYQFLTLLPIYYYRGFPFFLPFHPYSFDLSLWSGISIPRGTMNSFEAFFHNYKSLSTISSISLGSASPRNESHSFTQLLGRHKNPFLNFGLILSPPPPQSDVVQFITPNPLAEPSQTHTTYPSYTIVSKECTTTTLCPGSLPFIISLPSQFTHPWASAVQRG